MQVVVPYAPREPKTRLAEILSGPERESFARAMLADVLDAVAATGHDPVVLATEPVDADAEVVVDERPLTPAVNAALDATPVPAAVVMADLALATPAALARLFEAEGDVVLAPGRGAGTNALVARHPEFRVDYHDGSYLDHRAIAREVDADLAVVDSFRLATDVDEPEDLAELLVHGDDSRRAYRWLADTDISLTVRDGRTTVVGRQSSEGRPPGE